MRKLIVAGRQAGTKYGLAAVLIAGIGFAFCSTYQGGIERGHDTKVVVHGAYFFRAACGVLSVQKYHTGRYVCAEGARRQMENAGLTYEHAREILAAANTSATSGQVQTSKGANELASDKLIDVRLTEVFQLLPTSHEGSIDSIGWGMDGGYMDFVHLAFASFGPKIQSLYLMFFVLLGFSTAVACIQFYKHLFPLFALFALQWVLWRFLSALDAFEMHSFMNPRFLSILAIPPILHIVFLIVLRIRPSAGVILLCIPQAVLLAMTGISALPPIGR